MQETSKRPNRARSEIAHLRSPCPVANLLDLVGDKWSLLVVRDLFRGRRTYSELQDSPEQIPTNILADRLKRLEKAGIITRSPYQQRPVRYAYRLTQKGRDLNDLLSAVIRWAKRHLPGTRTFDELPGRKAHRKARAR
jgi:DNA-binding HxlR family transcriptional regulator